ncbi:MULTISPECIES: hypothetical protein [Halorussus]|uniref:hypothetical protein n=1 Tax=Halorussus TaxID=1070314 RepID=UPI0020A0BA81|nr:hypothetical protein [Halorussus vallis]USZ74037.1 hypothetical protein NGM07_11275 [Halorussus vallis]
MTKSSITRSEAIWMVIGRDYIQTCDVVEAVPAHRRTVQRELRGMEDEGWLTRDGDGYVAGPRTERFVEDIIREGER